jgi:stage II sporulation protein D
VIPGKTRLSPATAVGVAVMVALAVAWSCRSLPTPRPSAPTARPSVGTPQAFDPETHVDPPAIRIGVLTEAPRVSIGADVGVLVFPLEAKGSGAVGGESVALPRATFVPVMGPKAALPPVSLFRAQVASLGRESGATAIAARVEQTVGWKPTVQWNPETQTNQVRVGEFKSREEAQVLVTRLFRSGFPSGFVVEERAPAVAGKIRLLETGEDMLSATVVPASGRDGLFADATPYRGILEVRAGEASSLTVVNFINVEDYLKGVVPNELSPLAFPQLDALKAQSVAARTYALRNKGLYVSRGYDLCATAACQVYRGRSTESPLSDRAVDETRGMVASYRGALIDALYTSTCGGHTEDGENVFEGKAEPYLRGVVCAPERTAWAAIHTSAVPKTIGEDPSLTRDLALLVSLGVVEPRLSAKGALSGVATEADIKAWSARLLAALHRKGCPSVAEPPLARRGSFFVHLVGTLCWDERAKRLLNPDDADYLLQIEDRSELAGEGERLAAALLIEEGVLSPFPDNTLRVNAVLTRGQAITLLARAVERAGAPGLITGQFHGVNEGQLTVMREQAEETYPLDAAVRLFRDLEGVHAAASELSLAVGDAVSFILEDGRVVYLEGAQTRKGVSADRDSRYYRWEVRLTPAQVSKAVARYGDVGTIRELTPKRIGVSGRVVELNLNGSRGDLLLSGMKVRWGLGLRENLFVIDRETDGKGTVSKFIFTGKGWGHGVGLCQVGAFGMAQAGSSFEQILAHYYTGIRLDRAYP